MSDREKEKKNCELLYKYLIETIKNNEKGKQIDLLFNKYMRKKNRLKYKDFKIRLAKLEDIGTEVSSYVEIYETKNEIVDSDEESEEEDDNKMEEEEVELESGKDTPNPIHIIESSDSDSYESQNEAELEPQERIYQNLARNPYQTIDRNKICRITEIEKYLDAKGINIDSDSLQTGLLYFMKKSIESLKRISHESQFNEERNINRYYTQVKKDQVEKGNAQLVVTKDPLSDFKFSEKREDELQKLYDDIINHNREEEEAKRMEESKTKSEGKTKKQFSEDTEIFKMIFKMKQDKAKDNETTDKLNEDQNMAVAFFINGKNEAKEKNDTFLAKRSEMDNTLHRDSNRTYISHKHLICYLEENRRYKRSKYLMKAYMQR